jgi:hypothetical protein
MSADSVDGNGRIAQALALAADDDLQRELRNVRAKATLTEVLGEAPEYRWRYSPARIVRNVVALDRTVRAVAQDDLRGRSAMEEVAKEIAEAWESFAVLGERTERVSSLLYAAIAYELAGYQANAACLARRLIDRNRSFVALPSLEEVISVFLQRQLLKLPMVAEPILRPPSKILDEAELAERAAHALVAEGLLQASRYMLSGEEEWLTQADSSLSIALEGFSAYGFVRGANVTSGLRSLLPVIERRSTWVLLNDAAADFPRWRRYLRLLARGLSPTVRDSRSISELWPSQLAALDHGPAGAGQPTGRHPARLPPPPHQLRRTQGLVAPHPASRRLTPTSRGMSSTSRTSPRWPALDRGPSTTTTGPAGSVRPLSHADLQAILAHLSDDPTSCWPAPVRIGQWWRYGCEPAWAARAARPGEVAAVAGGQ